MVGHRPGPASVWHRSIADLSIDLIEGEGAAQDDFSDLTYTKAFDAMLDKFRREYAFTEFKNIDWDAKAAEFRPAFEAAERSRDPHAYALALRDFMWSIPDTHVGFDQTLIGGDFQNDVAGGLGFAIRETDDGAVLANYILKDGPADKAGMHWGAVILTIDGRPIDEVVKNNVPWSSPFSNPVIKRLQQLRYSTRFPMDKGTVRVDFQNPGAPNRVPRSRWSMNLTVSRRLLSRSVNHRRRCPWSSVSCQADSAT